MADCLYPLHGWLKNGGGISFTLSDGGFADKPMSVPCGKCIKCRIHKSKEWAIRIEKEAKMHSENSFLTLTYNDSNIPMNGTLVKEHLQKFLKRLRFFLEPKKIRHYAVGEYGEKTNRPHYHLIIFGYIPSDLRLYRQTNEGNIYTSETIGKLWKYGYSSVCEVSFELAQYTAKYVTKKIGGPKADEHYQGRLPEFAFMSKRPGIGSSYYDKYKNEIWATDSVIVGNDKEFKPPDYYFKKLKKTDEEKAHSIKKRRTRDLPERDPFDQIRNMQREDYIEKTTAFKKQNKTHHI